MAKRDSGSSPKVAPTQAAVRRDVGVVGVARAILRRVKSGAATSDRTRLRLLSKWLDAAPWTEAARLALVQAKLDTSLVRLTRWLLTDDVPKVLGPLYQAHPGPAESLVAWVLQLTAPDVAFFTEKRDGWVVNRYGPMHHGPGAALARDIEQAANAVGVPVPDALRVPAKPFRNAPTSFLVGHQQERPVSRPRKAHKPAVFVLLSSIDDWEAGSWSSDVESASVFNDRAAALAAFRSHQRALDKQARREVAKLEKGAAEGIYEQEGGFNVINLLFSVPLSLRTADDPPAWELSDDISEYVVEDGSWSWDYAEGSEDEVRSGYIDEVDLLDYLSRPAGPRGNNQ